MSLYDCGFLNFASQFAVNFCVKARHSSSVYSWTFCSRACRDASACASCLPFQARDPPILGQAELAEAYTRTMPRRTERQRVNHCLERGSPLAPTGSPACVRRRVRACCGRCLPWQAPQKIVMVPAPTLGVPSPTTALHRHHGDC